MIFLNDEQLKGMSVEDLKREKNRAEVELAKPEYRIDDI